MKVLNVSKLIGSAVFMLAQCQAFAAADFCAPQATAAAQAVANVNGTVSETVKSANSKDGRVFSIVLSEAGVGTDRYTVKTSGGHDCQIQIVKTVGQMTGRP
ncbi:MAG: hypothetical protein EOP05_01875 [Proteobacteria bacterium]|nr:MAG: hypothetical protein EOP05_01875 [Pseudomonadota bacterium]